MSNEVMVMPQLGESVTEGTIIKWFVKPGQEVNQYDPIAEVQTDKVTAEIPSNYSGVIAEIVAKEGETLDVGSIICSFSIGSNVEEETSDDIKTVAKEETVLQSTNIVKIVENNTSKNRFSPAVVKLATENGLELSSLIGTGSGGRITRKDVEEAIKKGVTPPQKIVEDIVVTKPKETKVEKIENYKKVQSITVSSGDIEVPVTGIRKAIATNMVKSKQEIPHAWMMLEVDVTDLVAFRNKMKKEFVVKEGISLTYFPFFMKAVSIALKEFPQINSTWAGEKIIQRKAINMNVAVATEDALFVPVVKNVDELSIKGIAKEVFELSQKVRNGKLKMDDLEGGTFTINNTGSFGSIQSMGIINHPQAAILQVESIVKKPVFLANGMFGARDMVNLCLSMDHRVLDGLVCGRFMNRVKELLENMNEETTSLY